MKVCTCLLLLVLLAHISSKTRLRTKKHYRGINPRAKITKKTDIKPISSNEMTIKATVPKKPTTTTTPRNSSKDESDRSKTTEDLRTNHDSDDTNHDFTNVKTKFKLRGGQDDDNLTPNTIIPNFIKTDTTATDDTKKDLSNVKTKFKLQAGQDDDKQRKHFKPDGSKSKNKHTNTHIIGEYNAVIDVQLANTELLNALGIFEPVTDKIYETTAHQRSFKRTKPVHTKPTIMRALTEIKPKKTQRTARFKPPSRYLKPLSKLRNNISTLLLEESELIKQLTKDHTLKQKSPTRRNANDTVVAYNFKEYVIRKIDALQRDLKELKHISNLKMRKNSNCTNDIEVSNVTDKYNAHNKIKDLKANVMRLVNENKDLNDKENSTVSTESTTKTTTYAQPSVKDIDTVSTTVINEKNTSKFANNNKNDATEFNKDKITNNDTTKFNKDKITNNDTTKFNKDKITNNGTTEFNKDKITNNDSTKFNKDKITNNDTTEFNKGNITNSKTTVTVSSVKVTGTTEDVLTAATSWVGTRNMDYSGRKDDDDDDPDRNQYITYGQVAAIDDMSEDLEYNMKI